MHGNVPVRFGRGRLDSLGNKGLAAYLIASLSDVAVGRGRWAGQRRFAAAWRTGVPAARD
jgi:hypothetical protein